METEHQKINCGLTISTHLFSARSRMHDENPYLLEECDGNENRNAS
jgi:hypothetical protein